MVKHYWRCLFLAGLLGAGWTSVGYSAGAEGPSRVRQDASQDALKTGDQAPDFELVGLDDAKVKLSKRFGKDGKPVVLLFSRAHW